jgi:hypothetical protein
MARSSGPRGRRRQARSSPHPDGEGRTSLRGKECR